MITVCLATYNGSQYISEQLTSVLNQLSVDDELLIADDGSTDNTIAIVNFLKDKRIRWVAQGGRLGVVKNFERALIEAKGDYIFLCDQDDVWLPGKISACVDVLQVHLLVVTDCIVVDNQLNEIVDSFFALRHSCKGLLKNLWKNSYLGCCMAFRKELLSFALPIPKTIPMHDMWLGMLANIYGDVIFLPKKLSLYRRHTSAVSPTAGKSTFCVFKMIQFRLVLLFNLFVRTLSNQQSLKSIKIRWII